MKENIFDMQKIYSFILNFGENHLVYIFQHVWPLFPKDIFKQLNDVLKSIKYTSHKWYQVGGAEKFILSTIKLQNKNKFS